MKRYHLFELEDQPWFPATVRDLATDYLQFIQTRFRLDRAIAPVMRGVLEESGATGIVDLCSGGSGPLLLLVRDLAAGGTAIHATLTDLYPNAAAFAQIAAASRGLIGFEPRPVDARAVPAALTGLRTLFNGFHHFKPSDAAAVLQGAAAARQPIAIFEVSQRSARMLLGMLLIPLGVWISTPFIRPFLWRRLLWTYLVPLVPLTCFWDGVVSQLRAYTPLELEQLSERTAGMRWTIGEVRVGAGRGTVTYMTGLPVIQGPC